MGMCRRLRRVPSFTGIKGSWKIKREQKLEPLFLGYIGLLSLLAGG